MVKGKPSGTSEKVVRLLEVCTMIAQKQYPTVPSREASEQAVYTRSSQAG